MKLRYQILLVVVATVILSLPGAFVPPPPESSDLLFKVGWYFGGVVSHFENLFR